jgi:hypothetical protein
MPNTTTATETTPAAAKAAELLRSLIAAVKAHAAANYESGWDVVVETMDDDDIAEKIGRARTVKSAISRVGEVVKMQVDRRIEVLSQSGEHDAEVAELVAASTKGRGRSKTGHPKADKVISDAKIGKAATSAAKINSRQSDGETTTFSDSAQPEADEATPAKRAPKTYAPVTLPTGYAVRWDNGSYDLAKKGDGADADGATWLVICKTHGTTTTADNTKAADALGRRAGRAGWCAGCKS